MGLDNTMIFADYQLIFTDILFKQIFKGLFLNIQKKILLKEI